MRQITALRLAAAAHLAGFRSFLMYHLKAAKTYLHARMRSRASAPRVPVKLGLRLQGARRAVVAADGERLAAII